MLRQLTIQIFHAAERFPFIEIPLIVSMASLDLTVVPRRSRTKDVMNDTVLIAKHVKGMDTLRFGSMCKLSALIRLDLLRCITEILDRSLNEVNGGITGGGTNAGGNTGGGTNTGGDGDDTGEND